MSPNILFWFVSYLQQMIYYYGKADSTTIHEIAIRINFVFLTSNFMTLLYSFLHPFFGSYKSIESLAFLCCFIINNALRHNYKIMWAVAFNYHP